MNDKLIERARMMVDSIGFLTQHDGHYRAMIRDLLAALEAAEAKAKGPTREEIRDELFLELLANYKSVDALKRADGIVSRLFPQEQDEDS